MRKPGLLRRALRRGLTELRDMVDDRLARIEEKKLALEAEVAPAPQRRPPPPRARRRRIVPEEATETA